MSRFCVFLDGLRFFDLEGIVSPPFHRADLRLAQAPANSSEPLLRDIIAEKYVALFLQACGECERGDCEIFAGYAGAGSVI